MSIKDLGMNKTGIQLSPIHAKEMVEGSEEYGPEVVMNGGELARVRLHYARDGETIGSVPPPASLKGATKTAIAALKGEHPVILIDKLAERLAFERGGARLYEALLSKFDAYGSWDGGPTREELARIGEDELVHFHIVRSAITDLGGDPTAVTPSANVSDLCAMGIRQVIADPRTSFKQCLNAMLIAELTDNDAWLALIALTRPVSEDIAKKFEEARVSEVRHLAQVRTWIFAALRLEPKKVVEEILTPFAPH